MSITAERIAEPRKDINAIIHRFRNRKQTPAQVKWCADLFAAEIELYQKALEEALREGERPCANCGLDRAEASKADTEESAC